MYRNWPSCLKVAAVSMCLFPLLQSRVGKFFITAGRTKYSLMCEGVEKEFNNGVQSRMLCFFMMYCYLSSDNKLLLEVLVFSSLPQEAAPL
jgi:hypothetical protein